MYFKLLFPNKNIIREQVNSVGSLQFDNFEKTVNTHCLDNYNDYGRCFFDLARSSLPAN